MEAFSLMDCEFYWDTRKKIPKNTRENFKKLKELSVTIGKALPFLKEAQKMEMDLQSRF